MSPDPYNVYINSDFTKFVDVNSVKTIFEIGARECGYTQPILNYYNECEQIHIFECNPATLNICRHNISLIRNSKQHEKLKEIHFNKVGISDKNEELLFYPVNVGGDYGSSSAGFYPTEKKAFLNNENVKVNCITIDEYCDRKKITSIDLMCIDIEGGELNAFKGAANMLKNTKYIIAETQDVTRNAGSPLRSDIVDYLATFGFIEKYTTCAGYFGDSIFSR